MSVLSSMQATVATTLCRGRENDVAVRCGAFATVPGRFIAYVAQAFVRDRDSNIGYFLLSSVLLKHASYARLIDGSLLPAV
jgi:hypothetical protein